MLLSDNVKEKRKSQINICEKEEIIHVVNKLRFFMIDCRKESRTSIDEACKLIQIDKKNQPVILHIIF